MGLFKSIFSKVKQGLERTRQAVVGGLRSLLLGRKLDDALIAELESRLIQADVGVKTTARLIDGVRDAYRAGRMSTGDEVMEYLKSQLKALWPAQERALRFAPAPAPGAPKSPTVILVAGVNGAGKTTSIAKLAHSLRKDGRTVLLAACDTFRAGAVRQLEIWADRLGVEVVKGQQGGDPAAVAYDACDAALKRGVDVLVVDTAGRLHTQDPLMRQLGKIRDILARKIPGAPHEVLLVLDATTGQNAVRQAEEFTKAIDVTGLFLAKLDGTAKGGVVIAIHEAVRVPVKFIGVGETPEDVEPFDPDQFVEAMFSEG
ncbi:MAG: signal recognition particle-docking protein FtsY [Planctomycetota bacterium]|nr:signal recognition particle-docking protein FtsY [Planctomycetota bacterium]